MFLFATVHILDAAVTNAKNKLQNRVRSVLNCSIQWQQKCRTEQGTVIKAIRGRTHISDHFAPGLVPLPVVSSLLFLLQHSLPGGAVLQRKLAKDLTEAVDADLPHCVCWVAQEQQKGMEPADHAQRSLDMPLQLTLKAMVY